MIAGPNGSGKSTLVAALRAAPGIDFPALYVNADDIQKNEGLDARAAQSEAQLRRALAVATGYSVAFETVMSHPSHLALLQQAREQGYRVIAHLVSLDAPDRNVQRVALRVKEGGHDVPETSTRARFPKTVAAFPCAVSLAHEAYVYDNSSSAQPLRLEAVLVDNRMVLRTPDAQPWVKALAEKVNQRAEELEAMLEPLRQRGFTVSAAVLRHGTSSGPVKALAHHVLQCDPQQKHATVHDKALLPPITERQATIQYDQGVATVTPVLQRER